ncbi:MAG TPA: methyltransferase domain-containing protein, partial [Acidimicrobiia bacterium]|nr:methyltransferase domain-containing protein [Acidimicrobiia bacterium]
SPFARRPASALAWLEPLDPDMVVLDVACGAAHAAEQAAPHVRQVVGVDLTTALLDVGAERLRAAGITNVLLQEGNATALPFVDASFDLVMCRGALHHFADRAAAVTEMGRVCRPGGRVVVADMVAPSAEVRDAFDELHRCLDPSHAGVLLEAELAELLEAEVGPLTYGETSDPFRIAVEHILTDAADRDAVTSALQAELAGGAATGFDPVLDDGQTLVSFTNTVVHAERADR